MRVVTKIRPIRAVYLIGLLISVVLVHTYPWALAAFILSHFDITMRD